MVVVFLCAIYSPRSVSIRLLIPLVVRETSRRTTRLDAVGSPLVAPDFLQMDCLLKLGDIAPVRSSPNIIRRKTEHFITLAGILNVHLTFRAVGDPNDLCRHHQVQFELS